MFRKRVAKFLVLAFSIASLNLGSLPMAFAVTPTFTGVDVTSGPSSTWVKLNGTYLARTINGVNQTAGFQTVYYKGFNGSVWSPAWTALNSSTQVQSNNDGTINAYIVSGYQKYKFHIDACSVWSPPSGCVALEQDTSIYEVTTSSIVYDLNGIGSTGSVASQNPSYGTKIRLQSSNSFSRTGYVFTGWNTAANGSGTNYTPQAIYTANSDLNLYAQWISNSTPAINIYMDAPFVQGSYAIGNSVKTDDFNSYSVGTICQNGTTNVGTISSVGCLRIDTSIDLGASFNSPDPQFGGSGSKFATNYSTNDYTISFAAKQKYVGFWWSAGSSGNEVRLLSGNNVVASMTVDKIFSVFGSLPGNYASSTDSVSAKDGTSYFSKYYFGNPDGYTSLSPTIASSVVPSQPYVYLHFFATNGAYFDGIRIVGSGFEIDNLTISAATVPIKDSLVFSQGVQASNIDNTSRINGVTYDKNGATAGNAPVDSNSPYVQNGTATILAKPSDLVRTNHTFSSWNTKADGTGQSYSAGDSINVISDLTLYAIWSPYVTATFKSGDGLFSDSSTVQISIPYASGTDAMSIKPSDPIKPNSTFYGWRVEGSNSISPLSTYSLNSNTSFTPIWAYRATFDANGGSYSDSTNVQISSWNVEGTDAMTLKPANPIKTGSVFVGWRLSSSNTRAPLTTIGLDSSLTFLAIWTYFAIFDANGGQFSDQTITQTTLPYTETTDAMLVAPSNPSRNQAIFHGWRLSTSADKTPITSAPLNSNITLKAIWKFYAIFDADGGSFSDGTLVQYSTPLVEGADPLTVTPSAPTQTNKVFKGWKVSGSLVNTPLITYSLDTTTVFSAIWVQGFQTSFSANGGVFIDLTNIQITVPQESGSDALSIKPSDPNRDGYSFEGWSVSGNLPALSNYSVNTNSTLKAIWSKNPVANNSSTQTHVYVPPLVITPQLPGIVWQPANIYEGEVITNNNQLNAVFSVAGNAIYSLKEGYKPVLGLLEITVTFTPSDSKNYLAISTTKFIHVMPYAFQSVELKPTPSPTLGFWSWNNQNSNNNENDNQLSNQKSAPSYSPTPTPTPSMITQPKIQETSKKSNLKLLGVIYFNNNEYFLDATDRKKISSLAKTLSLMKFTQVIIQGNTDIKRGVDNYWLSKSRAESVSKYLSQQIKIANLIRAWYAYTRPAVKGTDTKSLALNRRVEIYVQITN